MACRALTPLSPLLCLRAMRVRAMRPRWLVAASVHAPTRVAQPLSGLRDKVYTQVFGGGNANAQTPVKTTTTPPDGAHRGISPMPANTYEDGPPPC